MDRNKETANLIVKINQFRRGNIHDYELVLLVCKYFDQVKKEDLSLADYKFLKYIANVSGIPHFYDLLKEFGSEPEIHSFDMNTLSSLIYESTLHMDEHNKLHKYQKEILDKYIQGKTNRYFLSASTSFGKTHLVYEIIRKMKYKNILLIFPTISLLSENHERITEGESFEYLSQEYVIHTLSEVEEFTDKNICIYTPERYLSFIEKNNTTIKFDFCFIDEVYKIDNDYLIDEEVKENERDVAYRLAAFYSLKNNVDALLAGPYVDFPEKDSPRYNNSFDNFIHENQIQLLNFNNYEIVDKSFTDIKTKKLVPVDNDLSFSFESNKKSDRLIQCIKEIRHISQNAIVYCSSRGKRGVEGYAAHLIESNILNNHDSSSYQLLIDHLTTNFSSEWIVIRALLHGVGIHHGLVPKYIQKEIISLFNLGEINVLISTTTITEGVNTSAKNLIVLHNKKGRKDLKKFDAKNIAGRAGRFGFHYSGRVIALNNNFIKTKDSDSEGIKHKNYDKNSTKDEIDLFYSDDKYLSEDDLIKKKDIKKEQADRGIPDDIINQYKVVSRADKIEIYDSIKKISDSDLISIRNLIMRVHSQLNIDYAGFQVVLNILHPIIKNKDLHFLIELKDKNGDHSVLTSIIFFYLRDGFQGSINHHLGKNGGDIDKAIQDTSKFVYQLLKYQVVKHLGVFNIMYKFIISQDSEELKFDDVTGIDKLLLKFEYNALTLEGRIASDYGVPSNVVKYYENKDSSENIHRNFDSYEMGIFDKVNKILTGSNNSK